MDSDSSGWMAFLFIFSYVPYFLIFCLPFPSNQVSHLPVHCQNRFLHHHLCNSENVFLILLLFQDTSLSLDPVLCADSILFPTILQFPRLIISSWSHCEYECSPACEETFNFNQLITSYALFHSSAFLMSFPFVSLKASAARSEILNTLDATKVSLVYMQISHV